MRVNWLAILIAAVADWLLGAVWFKAFASQWQAGQPMPSAGLQQHMAGPNFWPYLVSLFCNFLMAYVIARLLSESHYGLFRGIVVGVLVGLAAMVAMITQMVFEIRPRPFILISAAYPLAGCLLMGIILGVWKPKGVRSV